MSLSTCAQKASGSKEGPVQDWHSLLVAQRAIAGGRKDLERCLSMGSPAQYVVLAFSVGYPSLAPHVRSSNSRDSSSVPKCHLRSLVRRSVLINPCPAPDSPVG